MCPKSCTFYCICFSVDFSCISFEYILCSNLQVKGDYLKLLKETPNINESTPWEDIQQKIKSDPRYQAVNNDSKRENWFDEYVLTNVSIHVNTH